ncbi:MAG: purine-nucleoside phosphorylase [Actinobacteria bacterium]|nr:MAG: purine-nucleoside phosphorylase [Actinomycetota bacterium]
MRAPSSRPGPGDTLAAEASARVRERSSLEPALAVVVGSGLRAAVEEDLEPERHFSYETLPGFPRSTVPGHAGRLVMGTLHGVPAAVFFGRFHLYEGHGMGAVTLIPRLAAELRAATLVLTNAAGGLDPALRRGQLMLIEDHINLLGANPLAGWRFPDGTPAFVDLSAVYDRELRAHVQDVVGEAGVDLGRGVYAAVPGPTFETAAETEFLRRIGAHAVGMSTVPEAVAGVALGMRILGVSCITNVAGEPGAHEDVLAGAAEAVGALRDVLGGVVPRMMGETREGRWIAT